MKRILKLGLLVCTLFISTTIFGQYLPNTYEAVLNEITENFTTINGTNSLNDGKTSLRLLSEDKIILRLEHKRKVKTLTFARKKDEEGAKYWVSGNNLTTDMVNKYEKIVTEILDKMLEISREKSKE